MMASDATLPAASTLACFAAHSGQSRGRRYPEPVPAYRSEYQRDRDRIVHSGAFRRLEYKTQVFVNHEGDLYRTRLTHSLEVAQIARSVARMLRLNEDLTEAIALAHDLGHTPFGHAGQDALNEVMAEYGGFEHNFQSLRVVDELEERYAEFPGLNLTYETREGVLKHCSPRRAEGLGELGARFVQKGQPSLEAQLTNLADEIAYNNHDVDDGLRAGLITIEQLAEVRLFNEQCEEVKALYPNLGERKIIHEVIRRMINAQVVDLIETSLAHIQAANPVDINDVRALAEPLIMFSDAMRDQNLELKRFLRENLYRHYRVTRMTVKATRVVRELFEAFFVNPRLLPPSAQVKAGEMERLHGEAGRARCVADYIAGMTDRYALTEHRRLFEPWQLT